MKKFKICPICKKEFFETNDRFFYLRKLCGSKYCRAEDKRIDGRKRYYNDRIKKIEYQREYIEKNKEKIKISAKLYREKNREKIRKSQKEYRKLFKEKLSENSNIYYKNKRDKIISKQKEYYKKNKDKTLEVNKKYRKKNKDKIKIINAIFTHRRRTLERNKKFLLTKKDFKKIKDRDKVCIYCGSKKQLSYDHIIPLSKNGTSMFNNMVIACMPCNISKNDKNVFQWCRGKGVEVPEIVKELLKKQREQVKLEVLV